MLQQYAMYIQTSKFCEVQAANVRSGEEGAREWGGAAGENKLAKVHRKNTFSPKCSGNGGPPTKRGN